MLAVLMSDFKEVDGTNRCRYGRSLILWQKKNLGSRQIAEWEQPFPNHIFPLTRTVCRATFGLVD
jgi:hypothetical protein